MNDYSDLIYLMGAMIIFSLLSVQTTRLFQINAKMQVRGEIAYNAISIAESQIEKVRWLNNEASLYSYASSFPKQIPLEISGDTLLYTAKMKIKDASLSGSNIENKKVTVSVTNQFMKNNSIQNAVELQFLKSFDS